MSQSLVVVSISTEISGWIIFSILLVLLISFTHHYYCKYIGILSCKIMFFAFLSVICYTISLIFRALSCHYWEITNYSNMDDALFTNEFLDQFFWNLANTFVHVLFLNKLYYGLMGSPYSMSKKFRRVIFIVISIYTMIFLTYLAIYGYYYIDLNVDFFALHSIESFAFQMTLCFFDYLISLYLLLIITQKLRRMFKSLHKNEYSLQEAIPLDCNMKRSLINENENIVNSTSKALVLRIIMIMSTQIVRMFGIVTTIFEHNYGSQGNAHKIMVMILYVLRNMDCSINSVCVFLFFGFTSKYYDALCIKCHFCIRKMCIDKTNNPS